MKSFFTCNFWQDDHWSQMLWHCVDNSSYQGCALPERIERFNEDVGENSSFGFNEDSFQSELPKPVTDEADWGDGWNTYPSNIAESGQDGWNTYPSNNAESGQDGRNTYPSNNGKFGQDSFQSELPKPVTDEADWGDGWK
jgi:helicase MOV-10